MIYFDAAYIAKCYLNEPGAEQVIALAATSDGLCCCEYGRLEFISLLHRHFCAGHLTEQQRDRVLEDFERDEEEGVWHWLPITPNLIRKVCARVHTLPGDVLIRAGDSLHLGSASENGLKEVYTNDRQMLACARHFELTGINIL